VFSCTTERKYLLRGYKSNFSNQPAVQYHVEAI